MNGIQNFDFFSTSLLMMESYPIIIPHCVGVGNIKPGTQAHTQLEQERRAKVGFLSTIHKSHHCTLLAVSANIPDNF